jgi:ABC-2 type transport system ATP-binding protein
LDLIQLQQEQLINGVQVNTSEGLETIYSFVLDEVLIGYNSEEYFYFIGDLRGQNKADVDALL